MRFWDTSALVPLNVTQPATESVRKIYRGAPDVVAWMLTDIEMRSAVCRLARERALAREAFDAALRAIDKLWRSVHQVVAVEATKLRAMRLLGVHALRSGDALQLAAALVACNDAPTLNDFVCLDDRLREVARLEGFRVLPAD
jgi:predicted nucleic acid-binding protein